jgi:hypothetical protein
MGKRLLAQALCDGHIAGQTFAFVAVILDCLNDNAKAFYKQWDFQEFPGHDYRLYLSANQLSAMMDDREFTRLRWSYGKPTKPAASDGMRWSQEWLRSDALPHGFVQTGREDVEVTASPQHACVPAGT